MFVNLEGPAAAAPILQRLTDWLNKNNENKLWAAIITVVLGVILRDLIPYTWRLIGKGLAWVGKHIGGKFGFNYFEKTYLNWLVTELRELKLAGIVSTDATKKPKLEQVFVSLRVGDQQDRSSILEITQAVIEDLRHHRKAEPGIILALRREFESAPPSERKDAEHLLRSFLSSRVSVWKKAAALIPQLRPRPGDAETQIADEFFGPIEEFPNASPSDLAAVLFRKILRDQARIAILGVPGSGKTTLLQYVGLAYARARAGDPKLRDKKAFKTRLGTDKWRVPVFVSLSSIASRLLENLPDNRQPSIIDVLQYTLPPDLQSTTAKAYFIDQLKKGRCIVLLDGLDEVPTENEFRAVTRAIESLAVSFGSNRFIVTSRIAGWRTGVGADFKQYFVNDLEDRQIDSFIRTWYSAVELNSVVGSLKDESDTDRINRERTAAKYADNLRAALRENPGIRQLATNPMLLSIIALVHRSLANLPHERSKLYGECAKILLEQWDVLRGIHVDDTQLSLDQKEAVIRRIAFALHTGEIGKEGGTREASREDVERVIGEVLPNLAKPMLDAPRLLRRLVERSGILIERQRDTLAFGHLTFQEYFTARYLARADRTGNSEFLLEPSRLVSDWWRETILLYSGMLPDSSEFLRRVHGSGDQDDWIMSKIRLAAACLGEAVQVKQQQVRQSIGKDLVRIRSRGRFIEFSDDIPPEVIEYLTLWSKYSHWYSHALSFSFRTARAEMKPKVLESIFSLLDSRNLVEAREALETSAVLPEELISEALVLKSFTFLDGPRDWLGRATKIVALLANNRLSDNVVAALLRLLQSERSLLVTTGLIISSELGDQLRQFPRVIDTVVELFDSPDWRVRQEAAKAFLQISPCINLAVFDRLVKLLSDEDSDVVNQTSRTLLGVLERNPSPEILEKRIDLLKHNNQTVRVFAISAMASLDIASARRLGVVARLVEMYSDKNEQVEEAIIRALRSLSDRGLAHDVVSSTLKVAGAPRHSGRPCALKVLGDVGHLSHTSEVADELLAGLKCGQRDAVRAAAAAVGAGNLHNIKERFTEELCTLAEGGRKTTRIAALRALGAIADKSRHGKLFEIINAALLDKDVRIKSAAAHAAGQFGAAGKEFIPNLLSDVSAQSGEELIPGIGFRLKGVWGIPPVYFGKRPHSDFGRNSLLALTAIASSLKTEEVISELNRIATSGPINPFTLSLIIETISDIGARTGSVKALDSLFKLVPKIDDIMTYLHFRPIDGNRGFHLIDAGGMYWAMDYESGFHLDERLLSVAKRIEPSKAAKEFKNALESRHKGVRRLALRALIELEPSVSAELLPIVLKRVSDDDTSMRERSWKIISRVYTRRGTWKLAEASAPPG